MIQASIQATRTKAGSAMTRIAPREGLASKHLADTLCFTMLGDFKMSFNSREIPETAWRLGKAKSMIKLLALSPDHSMHREQIIDLLWQDLGPEAGSNNFHQALHVARRTISSILPDIGPTDLLPLRKQILTLTPSVDIWIDVEAFEQSTAKLHAGAGPDAFYQTIEIYGGDLLPEDRYEDWTLERRDYLREQYLSVLLRLAGIHEAQREANLAIDILRRVVSIDPLQEEAHASLMRVYALSDRRQQAIRQYERLRDTLERELDTQPDPVLTELHAAIAAGIYPAETWAPEPVSASRDEASFTLTESIQSFLQRTTDFVDREPELGVLESTLQSAIGNEGKIVLLAGEPGIGKTRLIEEFALFAQAHHIPVYWGRGYEGTGAPPYWPWTQIVREYIAGSQSGVILRELGPGAVDIARIVPDIRSIVPDVEEPPSLDSDQERFRLFDSMTTFLKTVSERTPVVLVLDDLHWFDRSSLLMLEFLASEIQRARILVVGNYRPVEVSRGHPLIHALASLARYDLVERINLYGLSPESVARYSEIAIGEPPPSGLPEAIHFQTSGNPFFVREIVQLLIDEKRIDNPHEVRSWKLTIPHGIRETVHLRADRLHDTALQVLSAAAVSGQEFELDVLALVTGQSTIGVIDALDELLSIGLVVEIPGNPERFRFTHAITHQTIYDDISQARRLRMHLRTGEAIESLYATTLDEQLPELAHHFSSAAPLGDTDKAIDYLTRAGKQSMRQLGHSEAILHFQRALQLVESTSRDSLRVDLLLLLAEAQLFAGVTLQARERYAQVASIAREQNLVEVFARAALGFRDCGFYFEPADDPAVVLLEEALTLLQSENTLTRVLILSRLSDALYHRLSSDSYRAELTSLAVEVAREMGDPEAIGTALISHLSARWRQMSADERLYLSAEANTYAQQSNNRQLALTSSTWRITALMEAGDVDLADTEIASYLHLANTWRQPQNVWSGLTRQAMRAIMSGKFQDARRLMKQALEIGQRSAPGSANLTEFTHRFLVTYLAIDDLQDVKEDAGRLVLENPMFPLLECIHGIVLARLGDTKQSDAVLNKLMDQTLDELPGNTLRLPTLALLAELVHTLRARQHGERLLETLREYEGHNVFGGNSICLGAADHFLGILTSTIGDLQQARAFLERSLASNTRMQALPFIARDHLALGQALAGSLDPDERLEAEHHLRCALSVARSTGMTGLAQQAALMLNE